MVTSAIGQKRTLSRYSAKDRFVRLADGSPSSFLDKSELGFISKIAL